MTVLAYQESHSVQSDFPSLTATLPNRGGFNSEEVFYPLLY